MIKVTSSFSKSSLFKRFPFTRKPAFFSSCGLKSVFQKLRFRDGFVWTVGLTTGINLHFQISTLRVDAALRVNSNMSINMDTEDIRATEFNFPQIGSKKYRV